MTVSDKILEDEILCKYVSNPATRKTVAQAVVNSAWTDFDPDNPPMENVLVETEYGIGNAIWIKSGKDGGYFSKNILGNVIRYADHNNFRFEEVK